MLSLLRIIAGVSLVLLLVWLIDLKSAWAYLRQTDWRWVMAAFVVVQIQVVLSALRWQITANRLGHAIELPRAVAEYYLATVANLSLPGGVTGDAARVFRNRHAHSLGVAAHGVLLERLAGQLVLLVISVIGWFLWPVLMQGAVPAWGLRIILIALILISVIVLTTVMIIRFAPDWITKAIVNIGPSIHAAWLSDRQWVVQTVLSVLIVATYLLVFLFSSHALGVPLSVGAVITIVPLVLLSMVIPVSVGGWGVREASAAIMWPIAGLSAEAGVATSVVYALISLLGCVPGLALFMVLTRD